MTPDQLATLARAMGYEVGIDDRAGYGVIRVMVSRPSCHVGTVLTEVFRPHDDAAQAWEVLAWMCKEDVTAYVTTAAVHYNGTERINHNGTNTDIRRAIVEAAVRVAEGQQ